MGRAASGTIRKLPSGRYQVRYWSIDGQRRTARQTFATKRDANLWLASATLDAAAGGWTDPRTYEVTLTEYSDAWLRGRVGLARRTQEIYAEQLRLHILPAISSDVPALGAVALVDLSPVLVRAWYGALEQARGHSVTAKAYVRLRQILRHAVDDDLLVKNPCRIERGGVEHHPEQRFLSMTELYDLAGVVPGRYRVYVLMAGLGGLRQGELAALRVSDLDLERNCVTIRRKRLRLASGEVVEEGPKSAAGRRTVALPGPVVTELLDHLECYCVHSEDAYVFTTEGGGPVDRNNFRNRIWIPATAQVSLTGLRFHDLRHTAGTLAAQTGATTKELMARLGHASPQAAMIYQHAADDRDQRIADGLAEMVALASKLPSDQRADDDRSGRN